MADFSAFPNRMMPFLRCSFMKPLSASHCEVRNLILLYVSFVLRLSRYCFMPPTERSIDMLLSLRMISRSLGEDDTLLRPSNARPPDMAPSPMTATTCLSASVCFAATAIPNAADMLLEAWPHVNVSYSDSSGDGNGLMPWSFLFVQNLSLLPVRILCG